MRTLYSFLLLLPFVLLSCDDSSDDNKDQSAAKATEVSNRAINGRQWRVTNYANGGLDQTAAFAGYIFEFDTNNLLTVTNGVDNVSGNWAVKVDGAADDDNDEFKDVDFNIAFTNPPIFEALTEDWAIISITDSTIELKHTSGGTGLVDLLTFERI